MGFFDRWLSSHCDECGCKLLGAWKRIPGALRYLPNDHKRRLCVSCFSKIAAEEKAAAETKGRANAESVERTNAAYHAAMQPASKTPLEIENERMRNVSGEVTSKSWLVCFLYILARDLLPIGKIEDVFEGGRLREGCNEWAFTNGWLATWARDLAARLSDSRSSVPTEAFVVFKVRDTIEVGLMDVVGSRDWELEGIFFAKCDALKACVGKNYCIGVVSLNARTPSERTILPCVFPMATAADVSPDCWARTQAFMANASEAMTKADSLLELYKQRWPDHLPTHWRPDGFRMMTALDMGEDLVREGVVEVREYSVTVDRHLWSKFENALYCAKYKTGEFAGSGDKVNAKPFPVPPEPGVVRTI